MGNRSSPRGLRPKCSICGLDLVKGKCPAEGKEGEYIICVEKNEDKSLAVYSTDSIFWRDFFKGGK